MDRIGWKPVAETDSLIQKLEGNLTISNQKKSEGGGKILYGDYSITSKNECLKTKILLMHSSRWLSLSFLHTDASLLYFGNFSLHIVLMFFSEVPLLIILFLFSDFLFRNISRSVYLYIPLFFFWILHNVLSLSVFGFSFDWLFLLFYVCQFVSVLFYSIWLTLWLLLSCMNSYFYDCNYN